MAAASLYTGFKEGSFFAESSETHSPFHAASSLPGSIFMPPIVLGIDLHAVKVTAKTIKTNTSFAPKFFVDIVTSLCQNKVLSNIDKLNKNWEPKIGSQQNLFFSLC